MSKNPIVRKYGFSDATLFQLCRKYIALLTLFLTDFTNYDADFAAPFATNFGTQVDDNEIMPDDFQVLGEQMGLTQNMNAAMKLAQDKVWELRRFVKKAFPNDKARLIEFGFNRYETLKNSQPKLTSFMRDLHTKANANSAALIAAKYSQARIDEIDTLSDSLNVKDNLQETKKDVRPLSTQTRVIACNANYDKMADLCDAGKFIYRDNPAKYNMFIINTTGSQTVYTGLLSVGETKNILERIFAANHEIVLVNTGTVNLEFGLMKLVGDVVLVGAGVTVLAGTSVTVQASALGDVTLNHFLNVTNNSGTDGSWSVTI